MTGIFERPLREALNEANPNKIPNALRVAAIGNALHGLTRYYKGTCNASGILVLPDEAKAMFLVRAHLLSGTGTLGEKVITVPETAPAGATNAAISAGGNVAFNGADATSVGEIWYQAFEAQPVTLTLSAVSSIATLPGDNRGVLLVAAEVLSGVSPGAVAVLARGATATSGNAALTRAGATIAFNSAQVVNGLVSVTLIQAPGLGDEGASTGERTDTDSGV